MFERDHADLMFVNRWGIMRLLRIQSVAEHSHLVTVHANDIATHLDLPIRLRLAVALYAPWHDKPEVFSGDPPGPNKRALLTENGREYWDETLSAWMEKTFPGYLMRSGIEEAENGGLLQTGAEYSTVALVVKIADWLEAAMYAAGEAQMGNANLERHVKPCMVGALDAATKLCNLLRLGQDYGDEVPLAMSADDGKRRSLMEAIRNAVAQARCGDSAGPWITGEDAERGSRA